MKPHEFLASVRAKARAGAGAPPAPQTPAAPAVTYADHDWPLDPAWLARQEAAEAATARLNDLSIGDDEFATAVWLAQAEAAFGEASGASPRIRIARILSQGVASGLTAGQLAALRRLVTRIDAASKVLGAAECRRTVARPQTFIGAARF